MGMYWNNWSDLFAMGGYGFFVWGSFGMCVLVLVWEMVSLRLRRLAVQRAAADEAETMAQDRAEQRA